jgi:hypothetical protein
VREINSYTLTQLEISFPVNCRITAMRAKKELILLQNAIKTQQILKTRVDSEVFSSLHKKNRTKLYRRILSSGKGHSVD